MNGMPGPNGMDAAPASRASLRDPMIGEIVRLEPMRPDHAPALFEAARQDESAWQFLPVPPPRTVDDVRAWMGEALEAAEAGEQQPFVVLLHGGDDGPGDRLVGSTRYLDIQEGHRTLEVGWTWLAPDVRGGPVNVEMKLLMLGRAFEAFRARRITLKTDRRNQASRRAIEKLGASCEGILRQHRITWDGASRDTVYYGIVDREWPAVRAWLERRLAAARSQAADGPGSRGKPDGEVVMPPRVGVAVLVRRDDEMLLLRRRGGRGADQWGAPGGWMDPGETPIETATRELHEETGLRLDGARLIGVTNDLVPDPPTHAVTLWLASAAFSGEVRMADDESSAWAWRRLPDLPADLFLPLRNLVDGRSLPADAWAGWIGGVMAKPAR